MRPIVIFIFLAFCCIIKTLNAQVFDDFHDQNLIEGLVWGGDIDSFSTNSNRQLQLDANGAGTASIFVEQELNLNTTWECQFWMRMNFNPSSLNFSRFYLIANQSDFTTANQALYLEFGEAGSQDAPRLYCRHNGIDSLVGLGPAGSIAAAFQFFFKFIYDNGTFILESKSSPNTASATWLSGILPWLPSGPYAGLSCSYTQANSKGVYLDDLYMGPVVQIDNTQLIFTEIMSDPEPQQALPPVEYIEVYNAGSNIAQLNGYLLSDANGTCTLPSFWLTAGTYATLVANNQSAGFNPLNTIEVSSFPSLNNTGEQLQLEHTNGIILDQITYDVNWHQDSIHRLGGFSLERCSLVDPCSASDNWRSSQAQQGGTPGQANSVLQTTPDTLVPIISAAEVRDSITIALIFSEPIDSFSLTQCSITSIPNLGSYDRLALHHTQLQDDAQLILTFDNQIPKSEPILLSLNAFNDCWSNQNNQNFTVLRLEEPQPGDLIINEILFDPPSNGSDFVEVYNKSDKYLNLSHCNISNGQSTFPIQKNHLPPKTYLAFCTDTNFLKAYYPFTSPENTCSQQLPLFYNDSGTCILSCNLAVLDKLQYNDSWHSRLLIDHEGVSLERLDPFSITQDNNNWFSAAQIVGYASPGRLNSQQSGTKQNGMLYLTQPEFSPDQDGYHDFLEIQYDLPAPNMLVQAYIYSLGGNLVKKLIDNELFGTSGFFIWDGSTEYGTIASNGIYILEFKAFSTDPSVFFNRRLSFARCIKH